MREHQTPRLTHCAHAIFTLVCACGPDAHHDEAHVAWVRLVAEMDSAGALDSMRATPESVVPRMVRSGNRLVVGIDLQRRPGAVRIESPEFCPVVLAFTELAADMTIDRHLTPRLVLRGPDHPRDIGYGQRFAVDAVSNCDAVASSVSWRQLSGPSVADVSTSGSGMHFEARMPGAREAGLDAPSWGVVPVSPRTSGDVVLEAEWRPARGHGAGPPRRQIHLAAASRARGLSNVALDAGILLAGTSWTVAYAPPGAAATMQPVADMSRLVPDVAGDWVVRDAAGRSIAIRAGRYDQTPLDCGSAQCHVAIAEAAASSPMTSALRGLFLPGSGPDATPRDAIACAIACHATGEPDVKDGGFDDVARELNVFAPDLEWAALPRALRRLGGVTCLACHGPGAIPEPATRWAILRADVCATCHDSPPVYGHVSAWRSSRMARADADPRTRATECARCHSTSGFLAGPGADRSAPPEIGPLGIGCAACHAPHDPQGPGEPRADSHGLVRTVPLPSVFEGLAIPAPSRICLPCHAPLSPVPSSASERIPLPSASAAAIWAGRGGLDPETGSSFAGGSIHGGVERGCLGCHAGGALGLERGSDHTFASDPVTCTPCHSAGVADGNAELRREASELLSSLESPSKKPSPPTGDPSHATARTLPNDRRGRAMYDVSLVLEDPAAASHNAPFARALLEAARGVVQAQSDGDR
jgi:hypothetical protein